MDEKKAERFADRLFEAAGHTMETFGVYLGDRLGLYRALSEGEPKTASELAAESKTHPRYAREWCEYQAVIGVLDADDPRAPAEDRRFSLPAEHAAALVDPDSPFSVAPLSRFVAAMGPTLPKLIEAFRSGGGVSWGDLGPDAIESQGDFNRPWLRTDLTGRYLPSVANVHGRLDAGARVADIACGVGWAGIAIARAYPKAVVVGSIPTRPRSTSRASSQSRTRLPTE